MCASFYWLLHHYLLSKSWSHQDKLDLDGYIMCVCSKFCFLMCWGACGFILLWYVVLMMKQVVFCRCSSLVILHIFFLILMYVCYLHSHQLWFSQFYLAVSIIMLIHLDFLLTYRNIIFKMLSLFKLLFFHVETFGYCLKLERHFIEMWAFALEKNWGQWLYQ